MAIPALLGCFWRKPSLGQIEKQVPFATMRNMVTVQHLLLAEPVEAERLLRQVQGAERLPFIRKSPAGYFADVEEGLLKF